MAFDPLKTESGLLGNVDVKIRDAQFINDPAYNNGQTLQLSLTMDVEGDDGGEKVENFSCGDGWESTDGGKTANREDGKERNFTGQSTIGLLFNGLVDVMGGDPACQKAVMERIKTFPLGPREAGFWKGLNVHLDRIEKDYGGEIGKREKLVIDGFNGADAGKATGAAKKSTKKAGAAKPAASGGLTAEVRAQLTAIAEDAEDHDDFMEKAMAALPEAATDEEIKAAIADDGEDSIYGVVFAAWLATPEGQAALAAAE